MIATSKALAKALDARGVPVFAGSAGFTSSHQFAILAASYGGGQTASKQLRQCGFLACGIGLLVDTIEGDMNGLRIGTPELVRWGMSSGDAERLADQIKRGLEGEPILPEVSAWRGQFDRLRFVY